MSPFLSRVRPEEVLGGRRKILYEAIGADPGVNFTALSARTGMDYGVLGYHLSVLERVGYVTDFKMGRSRRYFRTGGEDHRILRIRALLTPPYERTLRAIQERPGIHQRALARLFPEVTRQAVGYRARRLIEAGAAFSESEGCRQNHYVTHDGGYVLDHLDATASAGSAHGLGP